MLVTRGAVAAHHALVAVGVVDAHRAGAVREVVRVRHDAQELEPHLLLGGAGEGEMPAFGTRPHAARTDSEVHRK